jgi:glycosyltransferase involved in cell wall biosynthesis
VLSLSFDVTVVLFRVDYTKFGLFSGYSFSKTVCGRLTEYEVMVSKSFPGITQLKYLLNSYRFIVKEILKKDRPDIIHSHLSYPGGFLGTIIQMRKGIPNILTEHTRIQAYSRSWFHKQCLNYTYRNTRCIVSVSNTLKKEIDEFYHRQISVVPNFVDTEKFKISLTRANDKLNIGFIGGLGNYNKGLDLLLESASNFGRKDFIIHIGGGGSLTDSFIKIAEGFGIGANCHFYGELSREKIRNFYSSLDFFVMPSRYETFGIVVIEAMACGIPVIATKCGGPEDIVTPETGLLIEKENMPILTDALIYMAKNLGKYDKETLRRYAEENFGQKIFVERINRLYNEIITNNYNG